MEIQEWMKIVRDKCDLRARVDVGKNGEKGHFFICEKREGKKCSFSRCTEENK